MFGDTIGLTYNAVAKTVNKVNQDNYGSEYYLEDGTLRFRMTISHGIPKPGKTGESHFCRLDVDEHDATSGSLLRTDSVWSTMRTGVTVQDSTKMGYAANCLVGFMSSANITKLVNRES